MKTASGAWCKVIRIDVGLTGAIATLDCGHVRSLTTVELRRVRDGSDRRRAEPDRRVACEECGTHGEAA